MLGMERDCPKVSPQEALTVYEPHLPLQEPGWAHLSFCSQEKKGIAMKSLLKIAPDVDIHAALGQQLSLLAGPID